MINNDKASILFLIQNRVDDLRQAKSQQWSVTYYMILLFAGIIGYLKAINYVPWNSGFLERSMIFLLLG